MARRKKMRFPALAVTLLALSFVFGGLTGAAMYATGNAVLETPRMSMVSHTEYRYGEPGQIIARLVDFQGSPVVVNNCTTTILYPDKTVFVNAALMSPSVNITGDYYYNFTSPNGPEGVYEYQATCYYASGTKNASVTNSFHLSSAFNSVLGNLTSIQTNLSSISSNLSALSSQISSVNQSLSTQISDLSSQLNSNTTTVLNAISNVNSSLYQQYVSINNSIASLSFDVNNGKYVPIMYVGAESPNVPTDDFTWDAGDADVQFVPSPVIDGFEGQNVIQVTTADSPVINVTTSAVLALTQNERFNGTTYEVLVYVAGQPFMGNGLSVNATEAGMVFGQVLFNDYIGPNGQGVGIGLAGEEFGEPYWMWPSYLDANNNWQTYYEGWYKFQAYFYNFNGTHVDVMLYTNGRKVAERLASPVPGDDFALFVGGVSDRTVYFDALKVYRGEPRDGSEYLLRLMMKGVDTQFSEVRASLSAINTSMLYEFNNTNNLINNSFSVVNDKLDVINGTVNANNAYLVLINATTTDTYNYLTGTLANNVNQILTDLGVINATVNRIETISTAINATTTQILENQQNAVQMSVFSG